MNVMTVFTQLQTVPEKGVTSTVSKEQSANGNFQSLFEASRQSNSDDVNDESTELVSGSQENSVDKTKIKLTEEERKQLLAQMMKGESATDISLTGVITELAAFFSVSEEQIASLISNQVPDELTTEELSKLLTVTFGQEIEQDLENEENKIVKTPEIIFDQLHIDTQIETEQQTVEIDERIPQQIAHFINEISDLLKEGARGKPETASRLIAILQEWSSFNGQLNEGELNRKVTNELTDEEAAIWKYLVNVYEKRTQLADQKMYQSESRMSKTDLMHLLDQAMTRYGQMNNNEAVKVTGIVNQPVPITEVQQYTIHLDQTGRVEKVSNELVQTLQNIIQRSQFLKPSHNINQLTFNLQPENLGSLNIRLMQIDGEMMVKILVSTQVAKEMLESNLHQLRHMFAPHQVAIERNEDIADEEFFLKEENEEQTDEEQSNEEAMQQNNFNEEQIEEDFETLLTQISEEGILNE